MNNVYAAVCIRCAPRSRRAAVLVFPWVLAAFAGNAAVPSAVPRHASAQAATTVRCVYLPRVVQRLPVPRGVRAQAATSPHRQVAVPRCGGVVSAPTRSASATPTRGTTPTRS
ncbi:MAG: hypothetical protein DYG90_07455, partial [Chloroflexi bacterium CFX6]|nr:hypothetical protein [Chloroflexi bacterium CFX6]